MKCRIMWMQSSALFKTKQITMLLFSGMMTLSFKKNYTNMEFMDTIILLQKKRKGNF